MSGRLWFFRRWRPRSLQARQMLAASVGLVAFLALAGYALDAAFADTAKANLRERLKNYATAYAAGIDFTRDRSLYIREQPPDPRFDVPGSGLYLQVADPLQRLRDLFAVRDPLYRETAHFVIETGRPSVATLVNMILMQLELAGHLPNRDVAPAPKP